MDPVLRRNGVGKEHFSLTKKRPIVKIQSGASDADSEYGFPGRCIFFYHSSENKKERTLILLAVEHYVNVYTYQFIVNFKTGSSKCDIFF